MAITTMDGLVAAIAAAQEITWQKASMTSAAGFWSSLWAEAGNPAAGTLSVGNTANGLVPTDATAGAGLISAFTGANKGYLAAFSAISTSACQVILYDRLFHVGSISAAAAATTTLTAQPSFTGRVGGGGTEFGEVELWIEINVVIPATATTVTVNYQDGTAAGGAAQTATQMQGASLTGAPTKRMIPMALANGTGCQKINSVTVATPAASGSFNIVALRRLASHVVMAANVAEPRQDGFKLGLPEVFADSCLALMVLGTGTSSGAIIADAVICNG